jgi:manganese/zinc/iron transport system permease protein
MFGIPYNTLIVLAGAGLLGGSAGLVGCFATLRRRALTGDALAHAALPGVCLSFLIFGERSLPLLLLGAFLSGLLGIWIISALRRWTRVKEDAAIGIVLSVFFGAGVVLIVLIQKLPTGNKAGLDSFIFGQIARMTSLDLWLIAGVATAAALLVLLLYKEFKLIVFDPGFAQVQDWPVLRLDLLLMGLIAVVVVIGLPVAGVVLMAALLILPGVTARFWTDRLGMMLILSAGVGLVMGLAGTWITSQYRVPTGPVIVLTGTGLFVISLVGAPRRGLLGRLLGQYRFYRELEEQKLLCLLYDATEPMLPARPAISFGGLLQRRSWTARRLRSLLDALAREGIVASQSDGWTLTQAGLERAAAAARSQRLWKLFLTEHADLAASAANVGSDDIQSLLPEPIVADLLAKLRQSGRLPAPQGH